MRAFNLDDHISKTPDFPKEGITFYDISPALEDPNVLAEMMAQMTRLAKDFDPDIFAGIDARGFLFSMPLALSLKRGTIMVRKAGKLPGKVLEEAYALEYGTARLSMLPGGKRQRSCCVMICWPQAAHWQRQKSWWNGQAARWRGRYVLLNLPA